MSYRNHKDTDMNQDHIEANFIEAIARQFIIDTEASRLHALYQDQVKDRLFDAFDVPKHTSGRNIDFYDPGLYAALKNVADGLSKQDISDCFSSDVKLIATTLQALHKLEFLLPGVLSQLLLLGITNGMNFHNKAVLMATSEETMRRNDLYGKWSETIEAMNNPKQKDRYSAQVKFIMDVEGVSQAEAVKRVAAQYKKDQDSLARTVRRSNSRDKK